MSRNATTIALLAIVASAGTASAHVFIPMNASGKNYNESRSNTANGIITFQGQRSNGDPVAGLWDWRTDTVYEMPQPTDENGNYLEVESYQFRPIPGGQLLRGQTIPGVDIIVKRTPGDKAAYWDTRASDTGVLVSLDDPFGVESWSTNASADGSIIAGALYGDIDGNGVSRHAAKWVNGGSAELMPVPVDAPSSEVWWTSDAGDIACGAIGRRGDEPSGDTPKLKPASTNIQNGAIWNLTDDTYQEIDPSVAGAESLVLSALSADASRALTWTWNADDSTKGGLYDIASGNFTLLDAGDINGDGQIDLADRHDSATYAFSADASVIGGSYTLPGGQETAAFWIAEDGYQMHDLASYLITGGATGLDGWQLTAITGVSADGSVLSGWGYNPTGQADVWVAVIPTPGPLAMASLVGLLGAHRRRCSTRSTVSSC